MGRLGGALEHFVGVLGCLSCVLGFSHFVTKPFVTKPIEKPGFLVSQRAGSEGSPGVHLGGLGGHFGGHFEVDFGVDFGRFFRSFLG